MLIRDTTLHFGIISILLHWSMTVLIIGLFALGYYMVGLDYYHPWYHAAPWWHKSFGLILLGLLFVRSLWRANNLKPAPLPNHSSWERSAATLTHNLLYILLYSLCISGYLIATAKGSGVELFSLFEVPALFPEMDDQKDFAGKLHKYFAYTLAGFVALHTAGALKHHHIDRDETLMRMLKTQPDNNHRRKP